MNKLSKEEQVRVVACLVEGNSLRAIVRMTGVHRTTIQKLLVELGAACSAYQDKTFRNLDCKRIQCDEIWSFVYAKDKNVPEDMKHSGAGSVWTWVALDPDTKLVPCWFVSSRDAGAANHFMHDLAGRLAHRVQLTTDGHKPYPKPYDREFVSPRFISDEYTNIDGFSIPMHFKLDMIIPSIESTNGFKVTLLPARERNIQYIPWEEQQDIVAIMMGSHYHPYREGHAKKWPLQMWAANKSQSIFINAPLF